MKTVELGRSGRRSRQQPENDNLFGWTVFILLLCGFAVTCWIGTFYIFTHPEEPFNYHILEKLKKLDPPKRFELTAAPIGEFLGAEKLLTKYGAMSGWQIDEESKNLLRSFLRNYDHQVGKVPYVTGKFTVLDSYPLSQSKFCDSGVAVLAQSADVPTIYIEHLFPAGSEQLPAMQRTLTTGLGIELRRSYDLSAIIHIHNLGGGRLLFTCVPLLYGPYGTTQAGSGFQLDPPKSVNLKAGLPLLGQSQIRRRRNSFGSVSSCNGRPGDGIGTNQCKIAAQSGRSATLRFTHPGRHRYGDRRRCGNSKSRPDTARKSEFTRGFEPIYGSESLASGYCNADCSRGSQSAVATFPHRFAHARDQRTSGSVGNLSSRADAPWPPARCRSNH